MNRCNRNPQAAIFDVLIVCENKDMAHQRLFEDYAAVPAVIFPNGNTILRMHDGRFVTVSDRPDHLEGLLPSIEKWNWYGKFNMQPDLAVLREKKQVEEVLSTTFH